MGQTPNDRRSVQRLRFSEVFGALVRHRKVRVLDLSVQGAGIEHHFALTRGSVVTMRLKWEQKDIVLKCLVTRCSLTGYTDGTKGEPIYHSGLQFDPSESEGLPELRAIVTAYIEKALQDGRSLADGSLPATVGSIPILVWLMNKLK